jgi:hypothetical protein
MTKSSRNCMLLTKKKNTNYSHMETSRSVSKSDRGRSQSSGDASIKVLGMLSLLKLTRRKI